MHLIDQELNLMIRGRFEEGWKLCEELEKQNPDDLRHQFNRGWFLLHQGKYQEGFQLLEAGRFLNVYGGPRIPSSKQIWRQEDLTDKIVLINLEGGLGDQIIYSRFAFEVSKRGGKTIFCCSQGLAPILSRIAGVEKCISYSQIQETYHDYWIPSFSCSWLFGHTFETLINFPYIIPNANSVEMWKSIIKSDKIKIGIRWSGNPKFEHQQFRVFPPERLINFHKYKEVQLYSLQRDDDIRELPDSIIDLQHLIISWEDTAAAISNLDLVITSCTSVAHLSAAMGKPTWVIVPILPYHIWAYGDKHSPWYQKTTIVFRQQKFESWTEMFDELEDYLITQFNLKGVS